MKHLKSYENIENIRPTQNDYVIVDPNNTRSEPNVPNIKELFHNFINNNIGQIHTSRLENDKDINSQKIFRVNYPDPPEKLKRFFLYDWSVKKYGIVVKESKIIEFSKNVEDIEVILQSKKYNL